MILDEKDLPKIEQVRPAIVEFARRMELKCRKHDADRGPTGWRKGKPSTIYTNWLLDEWNELGEAMQKYVAGEITEEEVISECVDVGNLCFMLADVLKLAKIKAESAG